MVFKAGQGAGKSGSFFFFSYDKRFIIKTLKDDEKKTLLGMLDSYIHHFKKTTKNKSFLAKIYGIFTIHTSQFAPLDFIIQQNTAISSENGIKRLTFDLKGNTIKRRT